MVDCVSCDGDCLDCWLLSRLIVIISIVNAWSLEWLGFIVMVFISIDWDFLSVDHFIIYISDDYGGPELINGTIVIEHVGGLYDHKEIISGDRWTHGTQAYIY
jgi:hypothetical protein